MKLIKLIRNFEPRVRFLKLLPSNGIVLDCGCGTFQSMDKLRQVREDIVWHGLDLELLGIAPKGVTFGKCNFNYDKLPYPDSYFDGVYALHVVEHISNLPMYSKEITRVLKPGGFLFVEVPSVASIFMPSSNFYDDISHVKPFTQASLSHFIGQYCGLKIFKVKKVRNFLKICLAPFLLVYSIILRNNYYMIGIGDIFGVKLYGIGKKQ